MTHLARFSYISVLFEDPGTLPFGLSHRRDDQGHASTCGLSDLEDDCGAFSAYIARRLFQADNEGLSQVLFDSQFFVAQTLCRLHAVEHAEDPFGKRLEFVFAG